MSNVYHNLAVDGAFTQNWADPDLITADDNWSGVPSIIGYRGDLLAPTTATDPQNVVTEGTLVVDVNANQITPNTFTTGGVTEFAITNPVVALSGSGTGQAPYLLIHLNTTGVANVNISYKLRDIDGSTDNSVQPVALQYRIGTTGNFTNIPTGFVTDASSGPSLATLETSVNAILPTAAENQAQVQVRIITTNAVGNDEWIGIDDINIMSSAVASTPTVNLSVSSNTGTEATPADITVTATASSAVSGDQTVTLTVTGTNITTGDYTLNASTTNTVTVTILGGQTTGTATFKVVDDALVEGTETATLTISSPSSGISLGSTITQNITITDNDVSANPAVNLSVSSNSGSEATPADVTVTATASSAVSGDQTVTLTVSGTNITTGDYTLNAAPTNTVTITILNGQTTGTATFKVVDDALIEGTEAATLTISSPSSGITLGGTTSQNITIVDNDVSLTLISSIQGSGSTSALTGSQTIEGIVTRVFSGSTKLNGFYVQEENADSDNNAATSEAIFVFDPAGLFTGAIGNKVRITGTAGEFTSTSGGVNSSLTQLSSLTSVINLGASVLPTVTNIQIPVTNVSDLERYEGMLVNISAGSGNLTVTENFQLGRFGQVILAATGASDQAGTDARLDQYTQFNAPSVSGNAAYQLELAKRKIILDDGSGTQNVDPTLFARGGNPLSASNTLRGGDTVNNITGILDERFEGYRIQTTSPVNFIATNARPATPPVVGGTLKIASFNVLNYFNDLDTNVNITTPNGLTFEPRGANTATEFTRQRDKTIQVIINSGLDVIGLEEIENNGYGTNSAIQDLVNGLNAIAGAGTYTFITPPVRLGTDAINVGLIYKPNKATPVGAAAAIPDAYGSGAFDLVGRKPLAQTFLQISTGEQFTAVISHFKSKGSSSGGVGDADAGDGQGFSNGTRTRQAQDLATWLATKPTGTNDPDYILLGDFNAYAKEDPLTALATAGYKNLESPTAYSYVFNGQIGSLDHALATSSLAAQVTGAAAWHINADEPTVLDYNTEFKSAGQISGLYNADQFRASDHDPVIVGLNLRPTNNAPAIVTNTNLPFDASPLDSNGWLYGTSIALLPTVNAVTNQSSLNTTTNPAIEAGFFRADRVLDRTVGYTVNFSAQILSESREASANKNNDGLDDRAGFSAIVIGNDLKGLEIGFFSDRIWVQQDGVAPNLFTQAESVSFDTTKQATYTLTALGDKYTLQAKEIGGTNATATLYGVLRNYSASGVTVTLNGRTVAPYNTPNFIFFGDDTTSARASFNLSNVSVLNGATAIALPSLAENSVNNTVVGSIQAADIDGNALTYTITAGNTNGAFVINSNGQVTVANITAIDFETNPNFNLIVQVSDGSLIDTVTVAIALTNVNDAPTVNSPIASQTANNGKAFNFTFGSSVFTDPEGQSLIYSASGLPSWLQFNPTTRTFSGTANGLATSSITLSASDGTNTTNTNFSLVVTPSVVTSPTLVQVSNSDIFTIAGTDTLKLKVLLSDSKSSFVNEVGVFVVDDASGKINGLSVGDAGYSKAALARAKVIFSALSNKPGGFDASNLGSLVEFTSGANLRFYLVKNSSTEDTLKSSNFTNVLFSKDSTKIDNLGNSNFVVNWEDGSGINDFKDLGITIQASNEPIALGTNLQRNSVGGELLDLRFASGLSSDTKSIKADFVVNREAAFNNFVGFYKVADVNGGIDTNGDGTADIFTGQSGYIQAAIRGRVAGIDLSVNNQGTATFTGVFMPGSIFAPFIVVNGTPDLLLDANTANDPAVYFPFLGSNSDGVDHIRMLGNNVFGFEDLPNGGDRDFNDMIVKVNLTAIK